MPGSEYRILNNRLDNDGRHKAFEFHRDAIKRLIPDFFPDIDAKSIAWRVASFRFLPLDGSPHEITLTDQIVQILEVVDKYLPATEQVILPVDDGDPYLDGNLGTKWDDPALTIATSIGLPQPPTDKGGSIVNYEIPKNQQSIKAKLGISAAWDDLRKQVDPKRRSKPFDNIAWIYENMGNPPGDIDPEDVPSRGALHHLKMCQEQPGTVGSDFIKSLYVKTIPDKRQLEHEGKQRDDGRPQLRLLDAFDEEFEGMEAESDVA